MVHSYKELYNIVLIKSRRKFKMDLNVNRNSEPSQLKITDISPNGIECIDIIRHYTCDIANALKYLWRAGLKPELGKDDADKEIEDLKKAMWYINDYKECRIHPDNLVAESSIGTIIVGATGHSIDKITEGYDENVKEAIGCLLRVGIIYGGDVRHIVAWRNMLNLSIEAIQKQIIDIGMMLTAKELQSTVDVLNGKGVEGEHYVSKPGCNRDTEPEHYDPLNLLIVFGRAYSLTNEVRKKDNGAVYPPCEVCDLRNECVSKDGTESMKFLCLLHGASDNEYYQEVGYCKYSPSFGTIEVIDEMKEAEKELKEMDENDE